MSCHRKLGRWLRRARELRVSGSGWTTAAIERETSFLTIELVNFIANAFKWYFVSSALGARALRGDVSCPTPIKDVNEAIGLAVKIHRPNALPNASGQWHRRDEPPWHDPAIYTQLAIKANLSNSQTIIEALSGWPELAHVTVFRNYFAHRNIATRKAALELAPQYLHPPRGKPSDVLRFVPPDRNISVLEYWINQADFTIEYLCT